MTSANPFQTPEQLTRDSPRSRSANTKIWQRSIVGGGVIVAAWNLFAAYLAARDYVEFGYDSAILLFVGGTLLLAVYGVAWVVGGLMMTRSPRHAVRLLRLLFWLAIVAVVLFAPTFVMVLCVVAYRRPEVTINMLWVAVSVSLFVFGSVLWLLFIAKRKVLTSIQLSASNPEDVE